MFKINVAIATGLCVLFSIKTWAQPANDEVCNAIFITVENLDCEPSNIYSWTGATYSSSNGSTYCNGPDKRDVWFKFTVPSNGEVKISTANANGFSGMATEVYKSISCNALTLMDQNANGFPCIYSNTYLDEPFRTYKNLTPGTPVFLRVYPLYYPDQHQGAIKLCVANTDQMADDPCNAGYFPVQAADPLGQSCTVSKLFSWANTTLTPAIPNPDCIGSMPAANIRDAWFKIKVPASGKLFISSEFAGNSVAMQVLTATACNGSFTQVACQLTGTLSLTLTPNSTIYVRVFAWTGAVVNSGSVKICVAARNDVPAVNNSQGKVGIGIDSPFTKLQVVGSGFFHDKIVAGSDIEARGNLIVKGNIISSSGTSQLNIPNLSISGISNFTGTGNFSAATNFLAPANFSKLIKADSLQFTNRLGSKLALYGNLTGNHYGFGVQAGLFQLYSDAAAANLGFGWGNSASFNERARIINNGEVAFQTNGRLQLQTGTQSAGLWLANAANSSNVGFMGVPSDNVMGFFGNSGAGWALTMNANNGYVGIGLNGATAQNPLQFSNTLGLTKISLYKGTYGDVGIGVYGGELRLQNDIPNGKVSMGVIETNGSFTELAKAEHNGAYAFSIFGSLWANGTTYASDGRFKKNIAPLEESLEKVLQLQGVSYEMRADEFPNEHFDNSPQVGLIAQEVEKIVPEVVSTAPSGYKAIDYAKLVPLLIESIKAQQARLDEQAKEIEALKKQVSGKKR